MSNITNVFNFSRPLPEPFDTLKSKKIKVSSRYGDGTQSTLCASIVKAVNAACACMNRSGEGAYGTLDAKGIAEYSSSNSPEEFHIVVYDSTNGTILASVYDKSTEVIESYVAHNSARDGAAIIMAMLPALLVDDEFKENFDAYYDQFLVGYTDMTATTNAMAYMCDNAYRRIKDDGCSAHVPWKLTSPAISCELHAATLIQVVLHLMQYLRVNLPFSVQRDLHLSKRQAPLLSILIL